MDKFTVAEAIMDKINLDVLWKTCIYTLNTNVLEITDTYGNKFVVTVTEVKS